MSRSSTKKSFWKNFFNLLIIGFFIGSADPIPGVSGGTIALISGIYSRLIHALKVFDLVFLKLILKVQLKTAFNLVAYAIIKNANFHDEEGNAPPLPILQFNFNF